MSAPVLPSDFKASIADPTSTVCGQLVAALLKFPVLVYKLVNWMFDAGGNLSQDFQNSVSDNLLKPGDLIFSAAPLDTVGRLLCDGSIVSRATYARLFAAIGTTYGAGDGTTTFQLPDYRDNFPVGAGLTYTLHDTGGEATHVLTEGELASHTHTNSGVLTNVANGGGPFRVLFEQAGGGTQVPSAADGGGLAHNNLPPFVACFILIKT